MVRQKWTFVSALLPLLPLAFVPGCGGGAPSSSQANVPPPAVPAAQTSANHAPTIQHAGEEYARVGQTYNYQPSASDLDGDALRFTAVNLPPWASIDPTSGHISGTPGENDLGIYELITITVADATRATATAPFSITVIGEANTGYASLRWEIPMSKVDGSPLDDLAGYRILYGRSSQDLDQSVLVNDPNTTSYEFTSLPSGTWYFAVVAVNAGGIEGPPTVTAMKSI
jgi:hypothetical protein